jgi:hypothetical protein
MNIDLKQEWENISNAPFLYIGSILLIIAILWIIVNYLYKIKLSNKKSIIENLEKQILIYKDKNYIIGETNYSKLTNIELIDLCKDNLQKLKGIYFKYRIESDRVISNFQKFDYKESDEKFSSTSSKLMITYDLDFKVNTILLREQLLMRLPKDVISEKGKFVRYDIPNNPIGFSYLLSDFEMLVLNFDSNQL